MVYKISYKEYFLLTNILSQMLINYAQKQKVNNRYRSICIQNYFLPHEQCCARFLKTTSTKSRYFSKTKC